MSPILSDLDPDLPACRADACSSGRKPCPCPDACRVAPRERLGRPSRLLLALLDPRERAALTAGLAVAAWLLLIVFGAWRSA